MAISLQDASMMADPGQRTGRPWPLAAHPSATSTAG